MRTSPQLSVVDLTRRMIELRSVSGDDNTELAAFLEQTLRELEFETEPVEYEHPPGVRKVSIAARKGDGEAALALCGHLDTVPAEGWEFDPFQPFVEGGRLYGRGSSDMKGGVAAMLCAAAEWARGDLARSLCLLLTSDEERGFLGARALMERSALLRECAPKRGVIGEPSMMRVVNAHKGAGQVLAVATGKAAHSSTGKGVNANLKMIPFLQEMKEVHDMLTTDEEHFNRDFDPPYADWNITMSDGESPPNVTPPWSRCTVNFRPMPGQDPAPILARATEAGKRHGVEVTVRKAVEPLLTPPDAEIVQAALEATGQDKPGTVSYNTEALVLRSLMEVIILGPGSIDQAHTIGEWVDVSQLHRAVEVYAKLIERLCVGS